jgi:serine-type D-Ala-D-Ala carboxypeptidase
MPNRDRSRLRDDPALALALLAGLAALSLLILLPAARHATEGAPAPLAEAAVTAPGGGIPPVALTRARGVLLTELERRAFPGAALAIGIGPRLEVLEAYGSIGWREAAAPVSATGTLYDLASVTKAVATTLAVLLLAEEGRIHLDAPVQPHLPEFEGEYKDRITWRHLLTHTSGLPGGAVVRGEGERERVRRLLRTRGIGPGHIMTYTDLGFVVAWEAAQRVAGEPLERYLERRVWRPLGMENTVFSPGQGCEACAPTLRLSTGVPFRGRPSDLMARQLGGVTGSAGLFSTAGDMARLAAMIASGGELDGVRVLSEASVAELFRQQPGAGRRTLGWVAFCPEEGGDESVACEKPVAYGHTGWPGTSLHMEPGGVWVVLLTNRSYDVRAEPRMTPLRYGLFQAATGRGAEEAVERGGVASAPLSSRDAE